MPKLGALKNTDVEIVGGAEDATLQTFEDLAPEPQQIEVDDAARKTAEDEEKMVEVRVRVSIPRTYICGQWYSFTRGRNQMVPRYVRDWMEEQHLL